MTWNKLFENLTGPHLVKEIPIYPYAEPNQSIPWLPHFLKIHIIIIPSMTCLLSGQFPSSLSTRTLYAPVLSPIYDTCPTHLIPLDLRSTDHKCCLFPIPLRPKYLSQHPILEHPPPIFLCQCERPSFTPIQKQQAEL